MTAIVIVVLAALIFSSALLALRSLRVLYLELSGRSGPSDRRTILIAAGMLAFATFGLYILVPMVFSTF